MKKYILPFMSIALLMAMASCASSDDEVVEIKEESKLVPMTFTATQESNVGTRAALNSGNKLGWQTSDKISVFDGKGNQTFTLTGDVTDGKFSGEASSTATKFTAVYPYTDGATLVGDGSVSGITLPAEQIATKDSFDPKAALMMAVSTTDKKYNLDFKNAVSLVKITTDFACKKIVLSANENIAGTGTLNYNTDAPSITFKSNQSQTITLKPETGSISFAAGTYYMVVPSITLNGFTITFTTEYDEEYMRKSTKINTFNRNMIKDFGSFATTGDYWYYAARGDKVRADQEVDLGLTITIGTKNYKVIFTNANLTATGLAENETDYGDYFAWGATEPWYSSLDNSLSDCTKWTAAWDKSGGYALSNCPSYDNDSEYVEDGVLKKQYDPARQILGGDWQLPTKEIWENLIGVSTKSWDDSKKGYKFENNDKTLFLPASGYAFVTSFYNVGSGGSYWSGTTYSSTEAYYFTLDNPYGVTTNNRQYRYCGYAVRPVRLVDLAGGDTAATTEGFGTEIGVNW